MLFRRDLSMPTVSVMSVILVYEYFGLSIVITMLLFISFLAFILVRSGRIFDTASTRIFTCIALLLAWMSVAHLYQIDHIDRLLPAMEGQTVSVEGRILDIRIKDSADGRRYLIEIAADRLYASDTASLSLQNDDPKIIDRSKGVLKNEKMLISCGVGDNRGEGQRSCEKIAPGDRVRVRGKVRIPEPARNPNTFDYRGYLRTKGIYTTMYTDEIAVVVSSNSLRANLHRSKLRFIEGISEDTGRDTAAMMQAILFGDKGCMEEDIQETFRMNGTAHILAVSGLHVGMVYALILGIWTRLGSLLPGWAGRRGAGFLISTGTVLVMYAALTGFAPSVVRAVLMIILHIFAGMTGRYYDLKSATMAVFTTILIINPLMLFQSGFQMSFLAILSIAILLPYLRGYLSGSVLAGASVQLGLMPYMIYQFNWLSIASILINVPVILLAGLIVPLGIIDFVCSLLSHLTMIKIEFIEIVINKCITVLCEAMVRLNDLCCAEGVTAFRVCSPPVWTVVLFYMALAAFASESGRLRIKRIGIRAVYLQAVMILAVALVLGTAVDDGFRKMDMVFVDVGQGDCMHLRIKDGPKLPGGVILGFRTKNYLIDGGGSDKYDVGCKALKPYLLKNGVRTVDAAFVTHLHTDHYRGICELAREGMVRRLFVYDANRLKLDEICRETGLEADKVSFLHAGQSLALGKCSGAASEEAPGTVKKDADPKASHRGTANSLEVLWPPQKTEVGYADMLRDEEDENASSLIMRVDVKGLTLLVTGDMGEDGEKDLIAFTRGIQMLQADVLKVGHHGSKYSSSEVFLDAVNPSLAVIQAGKGNTYGHPTPEVLKRLGSRRVPVYRNDLQGAIGFRIREGEVKEVRTMICRSLDAALVSESAE